MGFIGGGAMNLQKQRGIAGGDTGTAAQGGEARICMPSGRRFRKKAWLCGHYEAQDVLTEVDDVDLLCPEPRRGYETRELWQRKLMYHDITHQVVYANPGLHAIRLTRDYDLFLARCQTYKDLLDVNAIRHWKDRCRTSVCWIDEMWAAQLPEQKNWLQALRQFDHVFVGFRGTVERLSEAIGRPCRYLPGAVDALRFTPLADPPERVIDVFSMGRRSEALHQVFLDRARHKGSFYLYDTFSGSQVEPYDHRQHRDQLANVARRSRYFVVAPGKIDCPDETQGQVEIGHRYFEGAAAGAVMVGQAAVCPAYPDLFPWPEAVIEVRADGSDAADALSRLDADPGRIAAISRRNAQQALLRHDWVYRWKEILRVAGMEASAGMRAREERLKEMAGWGADAPRESAPAPVPIHA